MSGFITIERAIWDHPLFKPSEMSEREAWMWMLAKAAWSDTQHRVGNEMVSVQRGSFATTLRELQGVFMWRSDKRVRTFLAVLEKEGMIGRTTVGQANAPKTHVTICNYDEYQSCGRTKDAPRTHHGRTTDAVKEQDNKITKEDTYVSPAPQPAKASRFDEFWNSYPHRDGVKRKRKEALAAYAKAMKAGASEQQIIDGAVSAHNDPSVRRGYARDPVTWLNQQGWTDETQPAFTLIHGGPRDQSPQHPRRITNSDATAIAINVCGRTSRAPDPDWL